MIQFFKGFVVFILLLILLIIILLALIFPENYDKHISQVSALVGALTALVAVVWTQYNKSIEEKNKQRQFELDKKHQISKETYQRLFEQRMTFYKELHELLFQYKVKLVDVGREIYHFEDEANYKEELTIESITIKHFKNMLKRIKDNSFIVSNEIEDMYKILYLAYKKNRSQFDNLFELGVISDEREARTENKCLEKELFFEHKRNIDKLMQQLELEIKKIKSEIGFL